MKQALALFDCTSEQSQPAAGTSLRSVKRLGAIALIALAAGCTTINTNPTGVVPDQVFVRGAATAGANEIAAAKVAQQKATDPAVRAYAAQMIQDHTDANAQLKAIVGTKGVSVGEAPDVAHAALVAKMSAMSGPEFDRAYMQQQVVDHEKTVALFDTETRNGVDPDIRSFAGTTLPILQHHLMMAQQWTSTGRMGTMGTMNR